MMLKLPFPVFLLENILQLENNFFSLDTLSLLLVLMKFIFDAFTVNEGAECGSKTAVCLVCL